MTKLAHRLMFRARSFVQESISLMFAICIPSSRFVALISDHPLDEHDTTTLRYNRERSTENATCNESIERR